MPLRPMTRVIIEDAHVTGDGAQVEVVTDFAEMNLKPEVIRGINEYGFQQPIPLQQYAIVPLIKGRDVIIQGYSGIGKTMTAFITILQTVDTSVKNIQVLILLPTRELARNLCLVLGQLGQYIGVKCHSLLGSSCAHEDIKQLQEGKHIVVATPGRVLDILYRRVLKTDAIKLICLDKADELLNRGFGDQICEIFASIPSNAQASLLCSIMSEDLHNISRRFMREPLHFKVEERSLERIGLKHFYVYVDTDEWKFETLCDLFETDSLPKVAIFCNTWDGVAQLAIRARGSHLNVSIMQNNMEPEQHRELIDNFIGGSSRALILSDGYEIDLRRIPLVINYDFPTDHEGYVRRVFGQDDQSPRKGTVIDLVTSADAKLLREIERFYRIHIEDLPLDFLDIVGET